jgi:hypothetical protein
MTRPIITRETAQARGLKRYYPGTQCRHGHDAERFTSDRKCCECNRIRMIKIKNTGRSIEGPDLRPINSSDPVVYRMMGTRPPQGWEKPTRVPLDGSIRGRVEIRPDWLEAV